MKVTILISLINIFLIINSLKAGMYDCPNCPTYYSQNNTIMPSFALYPNNWWGNYGALSYSNFYNPAAWSGSGINGGFYPGHGGGFLGKPNLYINAPKNTQINIKVNAINGSNILNSVPIHGDLGWNIIIKDALIVEKTPYEFLYYDLRMDIAKLQDEIGFCVSKNDIIPKLSEILKLEGFNNKEISDFQEYWSLKLPDSNEYCVFPQNNTFLDNIVKLEINPQPKNVKRISFIVLIKSYMNQQNSSKFSKLPTSEWKSQPTLPATNNDIYIREWGVGFLMNKN